MRHLLTTAALLLPIGLSPQARAHVPNIATFELVSGPESARLDVHMSTDGMHHVMRKLHPDASFQEMSPEAYEEQVVAALRSGIDLRYDEQQVALGDAQVTLAAHQSDVSFAIPTPSPEATLVHAHIDVMHEQHNQHNVFRLRGQSSQDHIVLQQGNAFRGSLKLTPAQPTADANKNKDNDKSKNKNPTMRLVAPILSLLMLLDAAI